MVRGLSILFIISLGFLSCEPNPKTEDLLKGIVVQTDFDEGINFASYSTYTLTLDTLGLISNSFSDTLIINEYSEAITQKIKTNLDQRGYSQVSSDQNPDLGVTAFVVYDFSLFQTISYPSYYGGFYSPYYGYYYPIVNTYASNQALLIIQIVDLNQKNTQNQFRVVWTCTIGDLVATIDAFERSVEGVDQAFLQTPNVSR